MLLTKVANEDKEIKAVTADTNEVLKVTAESEYTIWVKSVSGTLETWSKEASPLKVSDLGLTVASDVDKVAKEVEVQVRDKDGKVVETVKFYTIDLRTANLTSPIVVTGTDAKAAVAATGTIDVSTLSKDTDKVNVDGTEFKYVTTIADATKEFSDADELKALIDALDNVTATVATTTVTVTAKTAGVAGNSIVLNVGSTTGTLTNGADAIERVAPKLTLTFTGADLKEGTFTISMVIGGVNYAGLEAKVTSATTVEVTGFPETVTVGTTLKTPNTVSSIVGLETVNGEAAIVSSPITLP